MTLPDTRLAAYQGSLITTLTLVEREDDDALSDPRSRVVIDAVAGQTYHLQLGDAPGQAAGRRLLRWYAAPPDPPAACVIDSSSFIVNPSLEVDATGWALTSASSGAGDLFQRYLGDGANGGACAEVLIGGGGAGRGVVYTDTAVRDYSTSETTITVWLKVVGGTPRQLQLDASVGGVPLVPSTGVPYVFVPSGAWQQVALDYLPLPGVSGALTLQIATTSSGSGTSMVLRADCLQAVESSVAPAQPTGLACSPTQNAIRVTWLAVPGADGYKVRVNGSLVGSPTLPTFTINGLDAATVYHIAVSSFTASGGESTAALLDCTTAAATAERDLSCAALGFLELDGGEVCNEARDLTYLQLGLGGPCEVIGSPCSILLRELGYVPRAPALDPAPWHDPARPESAEFLGAHLYPLEVQPNASRSVTQRMSALGGVVLGPQRANQTDLSCTVTLLAATTGGMAYGKRWLENRLRPSSDACATSVARVRLACPPADGSDDALGEYYLYDVGLTANPKPAAGTAGSNDCCAWQDYTFTLTAGNPYFYHRPRACVSGPINTPPLIACAGSHGVYSGISFNDWFCGPDDPTAWLTSVACQIATPTFGVNGVIVTIIADGDQDLANLSIATYPPGSCPPAPGEAYLAVVRIPRIPVGGVLVYDAARELITFYPSAADALAGTNARSGVPFIELPDGQAVPWAVSTPDQPAACVLVGKRNGCGGSGTVRIDTQLREA